MLPHHPSHVARRWLFEIAHTPYAYFTPPPPAARPPSATVEAMNNTSFIILLQEICNTWNRMQYAVYLHAWRTQGASVASVCVTRREGKKRGEQRKQARVTPDSPSGSRGNYSPGWGVGCWGWWRPSCVSTHLNKGCVIFNMSMFFVLLFNAAYVNSSSCWHIVSVAKILLWHFGCNTSHITPQHLVYIHTQQQKIWRY